MQQPTQRAEAGLVACLVTSTLPTVLPAASLEAALTPIPSLFHTSSEESLLKIKKKFFFFGCAGSSLQ